MIKVTSVAFALLLLLTGCGAGSSVDAAASVTAGCELWSQEEGKFSDPDTALAQFTTAAEADSQYQGLLDAATYYIKTANNQTSESGLESDSVNVILSAC